MVKYLRETPCSKYISLAGKGGVFFVKVRSMLVLLLAIIIIYSFSFPVESSSKYMHHEVSYEMEGTINLKKQAGHKCNTGAEMKQVFNGTGWVRKFSNIYMEIHFLQVLDNNDWITAPDALENLEITTTIALCAPGKYVYDDIPVAVETLFPMIYLGFERAFVPLTEQIWAVNISTEPNYTGSLHMGFDAAYGPYAGAFFWPFDGGRFVYLPAVRNEWRFVDSPDLEGSNVEWGPDYVGDYFTIQQYAKNTYGITRRYIDISSPWSHGYLSEGLMVVGSAEIREALSLRNIVPAAKALSWLTLF